MTEVLQTKFLFNQFAYKIMKNFQSLFAVVERIKAPKTNVFYTIKTSAIRVQKHRFIDLENSSLLMVELVQTFLCFQMQIKQLMLMKERPHVMCLDLRTCVAIFSRLSATWLFRGFNPWSLKNVQFRDHNDKIKTPLRNPIFI